MSSFGNRIACSLQGIEVDAVFGVGMPCRRMTIAIAR
jgi:hypothetical protein